MTSLNLSIPDLAALLGRQAFAAYVRHLRHEPRLANGKPRLTQEQVVAMMRAAPYNLSTSAKDIFAWETGLRRPGARSKAALIDVLQGDPVQSDRLLLYPAFQELDPVSTPSSEQLALLIEQAARLGIAAATERIQTLARQHDAAQARARLAAEARSVSPEQRARALQILEQLAADSDELAEELLRYGTFLLERRRR